MNPDRLTGKLFNYFKKLKMSNTWFKETEKDIEELQITQEDIEECLPLKKKLKNAQGFQENPRRGQVPSGLTKGGRDIDQE